MIHDAGEVSVLVVDPDRKDMYLPVETPDLQFRHRPAHHRRKNRAVPDRVQGFETQIAKARRVTHAAARRALQEALLQQKRLDDFLDGVARFAERRGDSFHADRPAAEGLAR